MIHCRASRTHDLVLVGTLLLCSLNFRGLAYGQAGDEDHLALSVGLPGGSPVVDVSRPGDHGQRYLQIATPTSASDVVIRVTPLNIPNLNGGASVLYVGQPFVAPDPDLADLNRTFVAAQLICDPVPFDFGAFDRIAVYGAEITPSDKLNKAQYSVQLADAECLGMPDNEECWSTSTMITQGHYGDVRPPYVTSESSIQPNFGDMRSYMIKFIGRCPTTGENPLSKSDIQLGQNLAKPDVAVNFRDIADVVASFLGRITYATGPNFTGLCTCPSSVTCEVTACQFDHDCPSDQLCDTLGAQSGRLCEDLETFCTDAADCTGIGSGTCSRGFCVDGCGRCSP